MVFIKEKLHIASVALIAASMNLSGCNQITSSGLTTGSTLVSGTSESSTASQALPANAIQAQFVDAPVANLRYQSKSFSGYTDSTGGFKCSSQEEVSFYIGKLKLGTSICQKIVTPLTLAAKKVVVSQPITTTSPSGVVTQTGTKQTVQVQPAKASDPGVINRVRLLMTLDGDGNPNNGIQLPTSQEQRKVTVTTVNFDNTATFDNDASNIVSQLTNGSLVDAQTASAHFSQTLANLPQLPSNQTTITQPVNSQPVTKPAYGEGNEGNEGYGRYE